MGRVLGLVLAIVVLVHAEDAAAGEPTALNRLFHGQVVALKGRTVTLFYDFEDPAQLKDFEDARPLQLLDAGKNQARIENGRLVLEGSTSIRHKLESAHEIRARFTVRPGKFHNVGAVITEPIVNEWYVVYNLFDFRFNRGGDMHIGAIGLHEDEGAEDSRTGLVNYRDIFGTDLRKTIKAGDDIAVEVRKKGWKEYFAAGSVKGRGTSKGKTKEFKNLKVGLFVHNSSATFDDLTVTCTLSDDYLKLENMRIDLAANIKAEVKSYAADGDDARQIACIVSWSWLAVGKRKSAARALIERKDAKVVELLLPALRSSDRATRQLAIDIVKAIAGESFGYAADGSAESRAAAVAKIAAR